MNGHFFSLKWILVTFTLSLLLTGCNKDLEDDVNDLKDRVTTLEDAVAKLDEAIKAGKLITDVSPIAADGANPGGWKITFSDNESIDVNHGDQGPKGDTPYIWVNNAGNWASNIGSKPDDAMTNAIYEIKVDGKSVKAYSTSMRTINEGGFVAFEEYDTVTGVVTKTVVTTIPFAHENYITLIVENDEFVIFTINDKTYELAKAGVYPASITVIRDKDYVVKGGSASFNIAVNPATSKVYKAEAFELDFEAGYTRAYGVEPDFIKIKSVTPDANIKGQYLITIEWADSDDGFARNAPIFIVLNYTDNKNKPSQIISATPVIMNEQYVKLTNEVVSLPAEIYLFADETYTDSVRLLNNYHKGYIASVAFQTSASDSHIHLTQYKPLDLFKFSHMVDNSCENFATIGARVFPVAYTVTVRDKGVPAIAPIPEDPTKGTPAVPGVAAIAPTLISRPLNVVTYKVPTYISAWVIADAWVPNVADATAAEYNMSNDLRDYGYVVNTSSIESWAYELKNFKITHTEGSTNYADQLYTDANADVTLGFDATTRNLSLSKKALIDYGSYSIVATIEAKSKYRHISLPDSVRTIKALITFKLKQPKMYIKLLDDTIDTNFGTTKTYTTSKNVDVAMGSLFQPTVFFLSGQTPPYPTYTYATGVDVLGQGIKFEPVSPSTAAEYSNLNVLVPAPEAWTTVHMKAYVQLASGRKIPVYIEKSAGAVLIDANGLFDVKFIKTPLKLVVTPGQKEFVIAYDTLIGSPLSIVKQLVNSPGTQVGQATFNYVTTTDAPHTLIDMSCVFSVVYSVPNTTTAYEGTLPDALKDQNMIAVDPTTGVVSAVNTHLSWSAGHVKQDVRVTVTDIWGTVKSADVEVRCHRP